MNVFVFDIETIPDVVRGANLFHLSDLSPESCAAALTQLKGRGENGMLPHYLQKIVAISVVLRREDKLWVWSLGEAHSEEPELIHRFFSGIDKLIPTVVSWNGSGFDLPVLHYRALLHAIPAPQYWESGDSDSAFRWNNYLNRFHSRHLDLMDVLAAYQLRAAAPLSEIAMLCGFPGKMGLDGSQVWSSYQAGQIDKIRHYCETDVLNTYLVYLRFELMRGNLTPESYQLECELVKDTLGKSTFSHLQEFLAQWQKQEQTREVKEAAASYGV